MALIDHFSSRIGTGITRKRFGLFGYLALWRSRNALSRLGKRELEDIGISSEAAQREAQRPLWDVPDTWTNH